MVHLLSAIHIPETQPHRVTVLAHSAGPLWHLSAFCICTTYLTAAHKKASSFKHFPTLFSRTQSGPQIQQVIFSIYANLRLQLSKADDAVPNRQRQLLPPHCKDPGSESALPDLKVVRHWWPALAGFDSFGDVPVRSIAQEHWMITNIAICSHRGSLGSEQVLEIRCQ